MSNLTAQKSFRIAQKAHAARNAVNHTTQLRNSVCVLVFSSLVALASLLVLALQIISGADAIKAVSSIACLAVLLVIASIYSVSAIFWNTYWRERSRRVEAESDLNELNERLPQIVVRAMLTAAEVERSSSTSGKPTSKAAASVSPSISSELFHTIANRVTPMMVAQVQEKIDSENEAEKLEHA